MVHCIAHCFVQCIPTAWLDLTAYGVVADFLTVCRAEQAVPPVLAPFCHGLGLLHDLRKCVHYNEENCVALLRRFVAAQTLLLELKELKPQHLVLVQLLSDVMRDAYHLFQQFSER